MKALSTALLGSFLPSAAVCRGLGWPLAQVTPSAAGHSAEPGLDLPPPGPELHVPESSSL